MIDYVHGAYPMDSYIKTQIPSRTNAASFVRNEALYIYGGEGRGSNNATNDFVSISFNFSSPEGELIFNRVPMANPAEAPKVANARAVLLPDNNTVLLFGGFAPGNENTTALHILCYQYTFDNQRWDPIPVNVTAGDEVPPGGPALPTNREGHTATLGPDGLVYIYGGIRSLENQTLVGDFWSFNPRDRLFTRRALFALDPIVLFAHVGIPLPDGTILYTTGAIGYSGNTTGEIELFGPNEGMFYNTANGEWSYNSEFGGDLAAASSRGYSTAVLGREQRYIYFYGGTNINGERGLYRQTFSILDTHTWNYTVPTAEQIHGTRPSRRAMAVAGIITDSYMVLAQGGARGYYFGDVSVVRLPPQIARDTENHELLAGPVDITWVKNVVTGEADTGIEYVSSSISRGIIAAVVVIAVLAVGLIIFMAWRFRYRLRWVILRLYNDVWSPRTGEPRWAEATRLITKIILAFLFIAFFVFVVIQVLNSPNANFIVTEAADRLEVEAPEIRFCFDGYTQESNTQTGDRYPAVSCITSFGDICDNNIFPLNMTNHQPFFLANLGAVSCYLFIPYNIKLGENIDPERSNNGSELHFTFFSRSFVQHQGVTHVSFYPPGRNPNRQLFFDESDEIAYQKQDMTKDELDNWIIADFNDMATENILDMNTNDGAFVHYQIKEYQYLQDVGWNYVGFSPVLNSTNEVETTIRVQPMNLEQYSPMNGQLNELTVIPASFNNVRVREQKIYSLLNALGFLGGLFGLFIAFQALMFGHRPNSPWGVIHRWSVGNMKRSISRELTSRFDLLNTPVPLMNPVHRRFSTIDLKNYGPRDIEDAHYMDEGSENDGLNTPDGMTLTATAEELDDGKRLSQVEERMQLLELVFKSYYIDDEVFRRLDHALKRPASLNSATSPTTTSNRRSMPNFLRGNGVGLRSRDQNGVAAHENGTRWFDTNGYNESTLSPPPEVPRLSSPPPPPVPSHIPDDNHDNNNVTDTDQKKD
ncbi:hypothetical protein BDA99DRAFT_608271 [Phascolomyces articulosus]|uniref:Attractin/MKLN-like beta-propeller domain-containing protein n=1 Tax=Phascolomyces articulosus TaxID=60185 RepID=A0AAD5K4V8_9FUNG|nr:hypothetical protein BDA99DRAFT_608271 [Phascolomyces articulosus]